MDTSSSFDFGSMSSSPPDTSYINTFSLYGAVGGTGGKDYKFVSEPDVDLKCLICLQVATDPVVHDACGKIFCKVCIRSHGEHKACPHCRRQRYSAAEKSKKAIEALPVKCDNVEKSCTWVGTVGTLSQHLTECPFSMVSCPNLCGCTRYNHKANMFLRKDLDEHMQKKCPNKAFECRRCRHVTKATYSDVEEYCYEKAKKAHEEHCKKKRVSCPNSGCSRVLQRQNIKRHVDNCEHTIHTCKYAKLGCDKRLKKPALIEHEQDDKFHLRIALDTSVSTQGKVEKLENELKKMQSNVKHLERTVERLEDMDCMYHDDSF